ATLVRGRVAVHHGDFIALARRVVSAAKPDHAASDNRDFSHALRIPQQSGSRSFSSRCASLFTKAVPVIVGITCPSRSSTVPSNVLPVMLSCRHVWPGRNLPSATRQASFALVPVPQGERS